MLFEAVRQHTYQLTLDQIEVSFKHLPAAICASARHNTASPRECLARRSLSLSGVDLDRHVGLFVDGIDVLFVSR